MYTPSSSIRTSFKLHNALSGEMQVVLEPWGEVYAIPPSASCIIEMDSSTPGILEVVISEGTIITYAWSGVVAHSVEIGPD